MTDELSKKFKKDISRLRSEVRKLSKQTSNISAFSGMARNTYWTSMDQPWGSPEGRKAVLTEYFWQPIRGQPRRVDTNELRQFSQTYWVNSCIKTLMDEIGSLDWDIIPKDEYKYDWVKDSIETVRKFLKYPNKNEESFASLIKAILRDILEIDAGVFVKVFDVQSYDFDDIEETSGAPKLKPLGQRKMTEIYVRDGASFLKQIDKFGFEQGYWQYSYQIPAHPMWFNRDEIIYISEQTRSMSCYGYARTQSILEIVKSLHFSTLYNKRFFEETPIPDGALSLADTNEVEMKQFRNYWNNEFKAQPHKIAILNKDLKWQAFAPSQRELEFLSTQKWYYNLVISSFGLSPSELGITEDLNRATSATQSELVKRKAIRPFLKLLEDAINEGIIPEFNFEGIEFQFIYDDPSEKANRLANWKTELEIGVKTINEVRVEMGMEPIPGGDISNNMNSFIAGGNNDNSNSDAMGSDEDTGDNQEDRESSGYSQQREQAEAKNEKQLKKNLVDTARTAQQRVQFQSLPEAEADLSYCPICGQDSLFPLDAEQENIEDDMRCGLCGARFRRSELTARPLMEQLFSWSQRYNKSNPINNNRINKKLDNSMTVKDYAGFDVSKSYSFVEAFAESDYYKMLLDKYLDNYTLKERDRIRHIMIEGMKSNQAIYQIAQKIDKVIKDPVSSQRIARTEVIRLANQGNLNRMKAKGTKFAKFIAAPEDGRLCKECKSKDNKIYTVKQAEGIIPVHPNCYDDRTEIYTDKGWLYFENLTGNERILSLDPETFNLEWQDYLNYIKYHYKGKMLAWKSNIADLKVTPDHNMFVGLRNDSKDRSHKSYRLEEAKTTATRAENHIYSTSRWKGKTRTHFKIGTKKIPTELFVKFMGYYLSEGSVTQTLRKNKSRRNQIKISQNDPTKIHNDIKGLPYNLFLGKDAICFNDKAMADYLAQFGKSSSKYIPDEIKELSSEYLRIFLDAYLYGDGTIKKGKQWKGSQFKDSKIYFTSSNKMSGDLGELIIKCGKSVSYYLQKCKGKQVEFRNGTYTINNNCWRIHELQHEHKIFKKEHVEETDYNGFVYDVELAKYHILLVRRNGKVCWSGNCRCSFTEVEDLDMSLL